MVHGCAHLDPGGGLSFVPTVDVSNVGCWRWEGTASVTTQSAGGPTEVASATASFERLAGPGGGQELFLTVAGVGSASYSINGPFLQVCTVSSQPASAPIGANDGSFTARITQNGFPIDKDRVVLQGLAATTISVTKTVTCPQGPPTTSTADVSSAWLSMPEGAPISDDGQTITGRSELNGPSGTVLAVWNFHAVREQ